APLAAIAVVAQDAGSRQRPARATVGSGAAPAARDRRRAPTECQQHPATRPATHAERARAAAASFAAADAERARESRTGPCYRTYAAGAEAGTRACPTRAAAKASRLSPAGDPRPVPFAVHPACAPGDGSRGGRDAADGG